MSIKSSRSVLFISLIVLALAAMSFFQVFAQGPKTMVLHLEEGCTIENLDHELVPPDAPPRGQAVLVITESSNLNWTAMCSGQMPEGSRLPDKSVVWTVEDVGGGCGIPGWIYTTDFHQVITPSGQVKLTCHFPESPMPTSASSFGRMP